MATSKTDPDVAWRDGDAEIGIGCDDRPRSEIIHWVRAIAYGTYGWSLSLACGPGQGYRSRLVKWPQWLTRAHVNCVQCLASDRFARYAYATS